MSPGTSLSASFPHSMHQGSMVSWAGALFFLLTSTPLPEENRVEHAPGNTIASPAKSEGLRRNKRLSRKHDTGGLECARRVFRGLV